MACCYATRKQIFGGCSAMPRMSAELLARCTGRAKRKREETTEQFLRRVTHLYCAEKGIDAIESLGQCVKLSVLYLYDNFISGIEGLYPCPSLTHLYLHNNHITRIENLSHLKKLTKLYLSGNAITVMEGLEEISQLTELHIAHQRLPEGEKLLFDPRSLEAIAPTLTVLNVSGNCLTSVGDLCCLCNLTHFVAADNELTDMRELSRVLGAWPGLWRVELSGNPLCNKYKYRDRVITMCRRVGVVDGKEVRDMERQFLMNWKAMRRTQRKQRRLIQATIPSSLPILTAAPPPPLTLPALPPRRPLRHDAKRRGEGEREGERVKETELKLPELVRLSPEETVWPALVQSLSPVKENVTAWHLTAGSQDPHPGPL